jgi:hypothetical protein
MESAAMPLPSFIEPHITESHPPPPRHLNRAWLQHVYQRLWQARFRGAIGKKERPHVDFIHSATLNAAFDSAQFENSVGLVITTWNRPEYLGPCLESLSRSRLGNTVVVLVDDASDDGRTLELIRAFDPAAPLVRIFKNSRTSMHVGLDIGWCLLRNLGCRYLCNLDADTLVRTDWLITLRNLFESLPYRRDTTLLSGFNRSNSPCVLEEHENYLRKYRMGGINYFFTPGFYARVRFLMFNSNWDSHIQYFCGTQHATRYDMICCKPSVVQHIGRVGLNARADGCFDYAEDFVADRDDGQGSL